MAQYIPSDEREESTTKNNSTQQDSRSDLMEKSKAFQTSKLTEFSTTKPALQQMFSLVRKQEKEKPYLQKTNLKTFIFN